MRVRLASYCIIAILTMILSGQIVAQVGATAQLLGTVTDPGGGIVAGATVTVRNTETNFSRSAQSTETGYVLSNLPAGIYEVTVEAPGFAKLRQPGLELTVGQRATLNLSLQVAGVDQEVTITTETELVESTKTEVSQVIEERRIENLPINGRQFLDFALLTPNVDRGRSAVGSSERPGEPNQIEISFAGLHETASLIVVDGGNNTNRIFGRSRSAPSQEAVREFRVLTNSYGAEYGPAAGAVVNIITKSGGNQVHGSAYYYLRNNSLDARNVLAAPGFDELRQNQFGGTISGPVRRDRLFLFGNYEGQRREESPGYSTILLNNLGAINGVKQFLGLPPEVLEGKLRVTNYDTFLVRGDYQATAKNQLSLIYRFRDERDENYPASSGQLSAPSNFRDPKIRDHSLVANMTSTISAAVVNQLLFQYARRSFAFPAVSFEPHIQIPGTLDMGRLLSTPDVMNESRLEVGDTLNYLRGSHSMKFGFDISHTRDFVLQNPLDPGWALFPNLDAFLGRPPFPPFPFAVLFGWSQGNDGSRPPAPPGFTRLANEPDLIKFAQTKLNETQYGLFAQDQWRVTPKLTLNYGLRWDVDKWPDDLYKTYWKSFQPRVGLAYSLSDKVVLRASGGIYQGLNTVSVPSASRIIGQNPAHGIIQPGEYTASPGCCLRTVLVVGPALAAPAFLNFALSGVYPVGLPTQDYFIAAHRGQGRGTYTYQWSGQTDIQIRQNMVLSVGYLGVRGLNVASATNLNIAPAAFHLPNGKNDYAIAPGVPAPRLINPFVAPNAYFNDIAAQSTYHGATATLLQRFSQNYSFTANYTWSKTIDNSGGDGASDFPEDVYRRDLERALSKQHVPHRLVASFTAEGPERTWLRDFRFSFIGTAIAANYYTIYAGIDANNDGNPPTDRVGTIGRSTFKGDKYVNFDARLSRVIRFNERVRAELIAEAFNLFNTLNVTEVNTVYGAADFIGPVPMEFSKPVAAPQPSFGTIRAIASPRQIQFAFRLNF